MILLALLLAAPWCDPAAVDRCSAPIAKGEPSPLTGQVISVPLAIALASKAEGCEKRAALELDLTKKLNEIDTGLAKKLREVYEAQHQREISAMQEWADKRVADAEPDFLERPIVVAALTATLAAFAVWGAGQLR